MWIWLFITLMFLLSFNIFIFSTFYIKKTEQDVERIINIINEANRKKIKSEKVNWIKEGF